MGLDERGRVREGGEGLQRSVQRNHFGLTGGTDLRSNNVDDEDDKYYRGSLFFLSLLRQESRISVREERMDTRDH